MAGMKLFPITGFRDAFPKYREQGLLQVVIAVPWDMLAPHQAQAIKNHSQTLERLAQRGGLDASEAMAIIDGVDVFSRRVNEIEDQRRLSQLLAEWQGTQA
jgi:hypothetical protein